MKKATRTSKTRQRGAALLLCLFALLLLTSIGAFLYLSSGTETRISANYGSGMDAYYAAKFGIQEVRDRVSYTSNDPRFPGRVDGLADRLPTDIAGNPNGVFYVLNPAPGETLDPANPASRYFDDELCHDYNSGAAKGTRCSSVPGVANWELPTQLSQASPGTATALKWVRINMKTNRISDPFFVDATNLAATMDLPICWDGKKELLSPAAPAPPCDANGLQNVYMLTSLAVTPGLRDNAARRLLRSEVVAPSIRPAGAITMDATSASATLSDGNTVPLAIVDGRPHGLDGQLTTGARACSAIAALATDSSTSSSQLLSALNPDKRAIVQLANNSCGADGSGLNCTPALWWVRGTGVNPRYGLWNTTTTSGSGDHHDGDHSGSGSTTTNVDCALAPTASCYTNLNLNASQLQGTSPFVGGAGNQADPSIYQSPLVGPLPNQGLLPNQISSINSLVLASKGQQNYIEITAASLTATPYGTQSSPKIAVVTDSSLNLQTTPLSGFGILVVPNDLEVNMANGLRWTGIVIVLPPAGTTGNAQFKVGTGGSGSINGALLLQPSSGSSANLITSGSGAFQISYSCDAVDMAFSALPFKVVASSEVSY